MIDENLIIRASADDFDISPEVKGNGDMRSLAAVFDGKLVRAAHWRDGGLYACNGEGQYAIYWEGNDLYLLPKAEPISLELFIAEIEAYLSELVPREKVLVIDNLGYQHDNGVGFFHYYVLSRSWVYSVSRQIWGSGMSLQEAVDEYEAQETIARSTV